MITVFELRTRGGTLVGRGSVEPDERVFIAWITEGKPEWPSRYKSVDAVYHAHCGGRGANFRWRTVEHVP